jgi:hypothetical protein
MNASFIMLPFACRQHPERHLLRNQQPAPSSLLSRGTEDFATCAPRAILAPLRGGVAMNIVERGKGMLLQPESEWRAIEDEETEPAALVRGYVAIVAIVPAAASLVAMLLFAGAAGARIGFGTAVASAIAQYVLSIVMVGVIAFVADALAPGFEGNRGIGQALKLAAYGITPAWLAGVFVIIPGIGWLLAMLGGFYSLYVFFLGVPLLMRVPAQKAVTYTVVVVAIAIAVNFILGLINVRVLGLGAGSAVGGMPF